MTDTETRRAAVKLLQQMILRGTASALGYNIYVLRVCPGNKAASFDVVWAEVQRLVQAMGEEGKQC